MKLLYIHQYFKFPEQAGGTRSYDLATRFVRAGISVIIISSNDSPFNPLNRWTIFERDGIQFYMLNCTYNNSMSFKRRILSFLRFIFFTSLKSLQLNFDCILATSTPLTIAVPALLCKWLKKKPFIFEVRDVWPEIPIKMGIIKQPLIIKLLYKFEKMVYQNAYRIIPLSIGMDSNIKKRYFNTKSIVIPNISEIDRFKNDSPLFDMHIPITLENKKVVLYAGTLGKVNGLKYIIDLALKTSMLDSNLIYLIYGAGKEKNELLQYAQNLNVLNKSIFFFDSISKENLPYLYSKCTIGSSFVIDNPALWDNSANKFFDTLAASKPILINHKGWQADAIQKYNIGFVLPPIIAQESAIKFVEYINDVNLLKQQGENAIKLAQAEFSLDAAANKYMSILKSISNDL